MFLFIILVNFWYMYERSFGIFSLDVCINIKEITATLHVKHFKGLKLQYVTPLTISILAM